MASFVLPLPPSIADSEQVWYTTHTCQGSSYGGFLFQALRLQAQPNSRVVGKAPVLSDNPVLPWQGSAGNYRWSGGFAMWIDFTCPICGETKRQITIPSQPRRYCSLQCTGVAFRLQEAKVPLAERFWAKVDKSGDCWEWMGARSPSGYGVMRLTKQRRNIVASRLSWEIANGPIPEGKFVCHHCDNPACVRPDHLFLGFAADNSRDCWVKGRGFQPRVFGERNGMHTHPETRSVGERHPMHKLSGEQVAEIRAAYTQGGIQKVALARKYGVGQSQVGRILRGQNWCQRSS